MGRLEREGLGWLPLMCNCSTLLTYSLAVLLNERFFEGESLMLLPLASVLLLLTYDPYFFSGLSSRRRYVFPLLSVVVGFVCMALIEAWEDFGVEHISFKKSKTTPLGGLFL